MVSGEQLEGQSFVVVDENLLSVMERSGNETILAAEKMLVVN